MRAIALLLTLLASAEVSAEGSSSGITRFAVSASLIAAPQRSADQRFSIVAALKAEPTQQTGRFGLSARLLADAKTAEAACGTAGDLIFADGFEN